jgi:hypothetical protein
MFLTRSQLTAVIILVILVLVILIAGKWNTPLYEDYLEGFYIADGTPFCDESDCSSMMLFIGEPESCGMFSSQYQRQCYLIVVMGKEKIAEGFTMTYSRGWAGPTVNKYRLNATVKFDDAPLWPEQITLDVNMCNGSLRVWAYEDAIDGGDSSSTGSGKIKTLYADLVKNNDITNTTSVLKDSELVDDPQ